MDKVCAVLCSLSYFKFYVFHFCHRILVMIVVFQYLLTSVRYLNK